MSRQNTDPAPDSLEMAAALNVIIYDRRIRRFLQQNDPKALEQAENALKIPHGAAQAAFDNAEAERSADQRYRPVYAADLKGATVVGFVDNGPFALWALQLQLGDGKIFNVRVAKTFTTGRPTDSMEFVEVN